MPRRRVLVVAGVVVALVVAGSAFVVWRAQRAPEGLAGALELAPADTQRVAWTDWEGVRRELGADLGPDPSPEDVEDFLDDAFERDLTSQTALRTSAGAMQDAFGISPGTVTWELFAQSPAGAVVVLSLGSDADRVVDRLAALGFGEPADEDGVWVGGPDVLARAGSLLTPELQHVAVLADRGLVVASDQVGYLEEALGTVTGEADPVAGLDDVASALEEPLAAAVYTGEHACSALAMAGGGPDVEAEAGQLIESAGGVHPLVAFAMGARSGGDVRVAMEVEDADDAPADADARAALASGPAVGQGGDFADRFTLERAGSEGAVVTLDLDPVDGAYVLSDLTSGPVLFATC